MWQRIQSRVYFIYIQSINGSSSRSSWQTGLNETHIKRKTILTGPIVQLNCTISTVNTTKFYKIRNIPQVWIFCREPPTPVDIYLFFPGPLLPLLAWADHPTFLSTHWLWNVEYAYMRRRKMCYNSESRGTYVNPSRTFLLERGVSLRPVTSSRQPRYGSIRGTFQ